MDGKYRIELERVSKNLSNRKWRKLHKALLKSTKDIVSNTKNKPLDITHKKILEEVSQVCENFHILIPINYTFIYKEEDKVLFEKRNIIFQELELVQNKKK